MEDTFTVTELKSHSAVRAEELVRVHRSRWELENRVAALEAEAREQADDARDLRARLAAVEFQQRELLKGVVKLADDCDDTLKLGNMQLSAADPEGAAARQDRKWRRRVERIRSNVEACLAANGVSLRTPAGVPDPELDTIHSRLDTDAVPQGEVVEVLRPGILWNESLLRYSLVVVASPPDLSAEDRPRSWQR